MQISKGTVFSFPDTNRPRKDLTISQAVHMGPASYITVFSLGAGTDISREYYPGSSLYLVLEGALRLLFDGSCCHLHAGDAVMVPCGSEYAAEAAEDTVYMEIGNQEDAEMKLVKPNEIFQLKDLLPTESGKIVNADIVNTSGVKIVLMSFDAGCMLPEHAAPAEALFFCLDGEAVITEDGCDYPIRAGQNFVFGKGNLHSVKAVTPFKMALILVKEA